MMKKFIFLLAAFVLVSSAFAQQFQLEGQRIPAYRSTTLNQHFTDYSVFKLDANTLLSFASQTPGALNLQFGLDGFPTVGTAMNPSRVLADNYSTLVGGGLAETDQAATPTIFTYLGVADGQKADKVAITVAEDFIYGFFEKDGQRFFIEPLNYFERGAAADRYVVYNGDAVRFREGIICSPIEIKQQMEDLPEGPTPPGPQNCLPLELEIAIANDYRMVLKYGSVSAVITHNVGVMNNVQANWDDEFARVILFKIVTQFVPASAGNDPFPATSDIYTLLPFFRDWANGGGFGAAIYDLGHFRSPRKLFAGTIVAGGATYTNQLCTDHRYSILSETASNNAPFTACELRTIVSHEMGHSFNASHTTVPGTDIMQPYVSCSDTWTPNSIAEIDARTAIATCLSPSDCIPHAPLIPASMAYICTPEEKCYTFDLPCVGSFMVTTNDVYLQATTTGTTICLESMVQSSRQSKVFVAAYDHCGNYNPYSIGTVWNITIDDEGHCPEMQGSESRNQANTYLAGALTVRNFNSYLNIDDQSLAARSKDIQVFDLSGKLLLHQVDASAQIQLPLESLPQGLFVVRVVAGNDVLVAKIGHW